MMSAELLQGAMCRLLKQPSMVLHVFLVSFIQEGPRYVCMYLERTPACKGDGRTSCSTLKGRPNFYSNST